MASTSQGTYQGYIRSVEALFDQAMQQAQSPSDEKQAAIELADRLPGFEEHSLAVRQALDVLPPEFVFTQSMAMFYLGYSEDLFKARLVQGPHPFKRGKKTTKAEVDEWHEEILQRKHADDLPEIDTSFRGRDPLSERVYIIDKSGAVVSDGQISSIDSNALAKVLTKGGSIRILSLTQALMQPWASMDERAPWAAGYVLLLHTQIAEIDAMTLRGGTQEPTREGTRKGTL
ncbi:hypothetical protein [Stenotrophomonas pigmentata]|uniref:hypothetical protein n=1 Tax=Stenotrophomonas pigmentata TaxID=3055080 RepID=UPI0026F025AA|nr:hypothetical protein [Stenotrophomonas sp. 610A2]